MDKFVFGRECWDKPFYKLLARNDTSDAPGHQGGMVIPKPLRQYFPNLHGVTTEQSPTIDIDLTAVLFSGNIFLDVVHTRYQYQTWRGQRSPESRITGNLGLLRRSAREDDLLIIQRSLEKLDLYKFILVRKSTEKYKKHISIIKSRWGLLGKECPVTHEELLETVSELKEKECKPFSLFEETKHRVRKSKVVARSIAFREKIYSIYQKKCCVCGTGLISVNGALEIEAAHIVPKSQKGADDVRNGLALCKRHHWAFDYGLFGIDEKNKVQISSKTMELKENRMLLALQDKKILLPKQENLFPSQEALEWHRYNTLVS
ncbi:MAG: HNH endonuclease [Anaerohalosphaeraceae bacterium]|nr:HNH endonuclease [Anaerohalosphaeraceae bacterium]